MLLKIQISRSQAFLPSDRIFQLAWPETFGKSWRRPERRERTHRVHMKVILPWLVRWACRAGTRNFCPALAALVGPVQHIFFLAIHYFNPFVSIAPASWAGSRAGSPVS